MKKLITLFLLLAALSAHGINRVTVNVTVTNLPVTGNVIGFTAPASKVITWSNVTSSAYVLTNLTVNGCATNLYLQLAGNAPWTPRPILTWVNTNEFSVQADCGSSLTVTNLGSWVKFVFDTNTCAPMRAVQVPLASLPFSTSRVEIASQLVTALNDYPTNSLGTNITAMTNYLSLGAHPQWVRGVKYGTWAGTNAGLTNGPIVGASISNVIHLHGSNLNFTAGYWTNGRADKLISTSLVNYGSAISSPGTNGTSEQFGTGAWANQNGALAVGSSATATNTSTTAVGINARAGAANSVAVGTGAAVSADDGVAIGSTAAVTGTNGIAIGSGAEAAYSNSGGIGQGAKADEANQLKVGGANHQIYVPGIFRAATSTNNIFTGTNVNRGDWSDVTSTSTSLANGNNVAVSSSSVVVIWTPGPTAAFAICGLVAGRDGQVIERWNRTAQAMTISHESGVDPTAANRIETPTAADVVLGTNAYVTFRYIGSVSRWVLRTKD